VILDKNEVEYATIYYLLSALSVMCCCDVIDVIDRLTVFCWDEEEAGNIKKYAKN